MKPSEPPAGTQSRAQANTAKVGSQSKHNLLGRFHMHWHAACMFRVSLIGCGFTATTMSAALRRAGEIK
jgi:hypothetical protein